MIVNRDPTPTTYYQFKYFSTLTLRIRSSPTGLHMLLNVMWPKSQRYYPRYILPIYKVRASEEARTSEKNALVTAQPWS